MLSRFVVLLVVMAVLTLAAGPLQSGGAKSGVAVDKVKRTVTIDCAVAPRKLPKLDQIYPLEVIGTWPTPKGQKAHETVVIFQAKPSDIHKALESIGLKAGKPARGQIGKASGSLVQLFLEIPHPEGEAKRIPIEQAIIDTKSGKTLAPLKWHFTGSALQQPDPEKDDTVYGADLTGTLATIYPVTDDTVLQSNLTAKDEGKYRLELNKEVLPREGAAVKLIIQAK
jgi:hypothetical protein